MKKHLHNSLRALFLSLAVFLSLPMLAVEVEIDGINYDLITKAKLATVIAKSSGYYSGEVVIPESVEHEGAAYSVTSIGEEAFYWCSGLTSVTIPNSVTSIGSSAFYGCSGLTSVHISDIAAWCNIEFEGYDSNPLSYAHHLYLNGEEVKDLVIPNSVESIRWFAFCGCSGLTSVTIPNSVTWIGQNAFSGCSGLTSVHISDIAAWCNIKFYTSNPLYYAHHLYLNGEEVKDLVIPNSVESIGDYAFCGCSGLTSVTIPNSVTNIGESAFSGCSGLASVTIPNSVTSIGWVAFYNCKGLTSVTIPNSVTSIGGRAFEGCTGLTSVTIGSGVTSIGEDAFRSCTGLTSVTIGSGVTSIGEDAFSDCSGLEKIELNCKYIGSWFSGFKSIKEIIIGNSVTSIGEEAFRDCSGFTSVTISNSVTSIRKCAFDGCSGLTSVTIGNSVKSIGDWAFYGCSGLTSVTIPNSVTSIGWSAFEDCSGLTSVTIGSGVEYIEYEAFANCPELLDVYCYAEKVPSTESNPFDGSYIEYVNLHVPAASIESYKATSPWSKFGKIVALTEDETGIDEVKGENGKVKTAVYDLSGRRVLKGQKGIFIRDGKVVVR